VKEEEESTKEETDWGEDDDDGDDGGSRTVCVRGQDQRVEGPSPSAQAVPHGSGDLDLRGASPSRRRGSPSGFDRCRAESSGLGPHQLIVPPSLPPLSSEIVTSKAAREGAEAAAIVGSTISVKGQILAPS
jgi:hypothetical protein